MDSTKELKEVPGIEGTVVIKKLGFGSLAKLRSKVTNAKLNQQTNSVDASMDLGEYMKYLLVYGVKNAPFFPDGASPDVKSQAIDDDKVSSEAGEYLFQQIQQFNNFEGMKDLKKKSN